MSAALAFSASASAQVQAGRYASLQIRPASLTLTAERPVAELTMSSLDAHELIFDARLYRWTQHGAADAFAQASEPLVLPPVYDVLPYERQMLRVGFANPPAASLQERAYQLRIREVPQNGAASGTRMLTVPVFVAPAARQGSVSYELKRKDGATAQLTVRNASNEHVDLGGARIESGGETAFTLPAAFYVLAGNTRTLTFAPAKPLQSVARIRCAGSCEAPGDLRVR